MHIKASQCYHGIPRHRGGEGVGITLQYSGPNIVRIGGDGLDVQVGYDGWGIEFYIVAQSCPLGL